MSVGPVSEFLVGYFKAQSADANCNAAVSHTRLRSGVTLVYITGVQTADWLELCHLLRVKYAATLKQHNSGWVVELKPGGMAFNWRWLQALVFCAALLVYVVMSGDLMSALGKLAIGTAVHMVMRILLPAPPIEQRQVMEWIGLKQH